MSTCSVGKREEEAQMFNESWPWKRELGECANQLRAAGQVTHWESLDVADSEDSYEAETEAVFEVERALMVGSFALRRLLGMPYKVTKQIRKSTVEVTAYPLRADRSAPDFLDAISAFDWYDLTRPARGQITTAQMCNLFVHSHVLHFAWDLAGISVEEASILQEDDPRLSGPVTLGGFYVATDTSSRTHLTRVELDTVADSFEAMAQDNVAALSLRRDARGRRHLLGASGEPRILG